jgi:hypothetical protein
MSKKEPFESPFDLRLKVIGVMLEPALTLACIMGLPLADLTQLVRTTYVHLGKSRGLSVRALAKRFGVAPNTIQAIATVLRDHALPESFGAQVTRQRAIIQHLADRGSSTVKRVLRLLPDTEADEMQSALDQLVQEGAVVSDRNRVSLGKQHFSIARKDAEHRLDSLRQMTEAFSQVVYRRFFQPAREGEAFGRVFTFAVTPALLKAIREEAYMRTSSSVRSADAAATAKGGGVTASMLIVVVQEPDDPFYQSRRGS